MPGQGVGRKLDTRLEEFAQLARGLAHPIRITIVRQLLGEGTCNCGDLVDSLPRAQSTVSQHLKVLRETGWVIGEIDGPRVCYCVDQGTVQRFRELVADLSALTRGAGAPDVECSIPSDPTAASNRTATKGDCCGD